MNVVAGIIDVSEKINLEHASFTLPNLATTRNDFLVAAFIAFLGRTCCKSTISVGLLADKSDIPETITDIYSDICPANIDLQMDESLSVVIEGCANDLTKYRESKTFPVDVFFRYPELRERKQSPHHNIVFGYVTEGQSQQLYDKLLLQDCNILVLFSEGGQEMRVMYNQRPGQDFSHITDVFKTFPYIFTVTASLAKCSAF